MISYLDIETGDKIENGGLTGFWAEAPTPLLSAIRWLNEVVPTIYDPTDPVFARFMETATITRGDKPKGRRPIYGRTEEEAILAAQDVQRPLPIPVFEPGTLAHLVYGKWRTYTKPRVRATSWAKYRGLLEHHILPPLGHLQLRAIGRLDVQHMMDGLVRHDKREGELSQRNKREVLLLLREVLKFARRYELMKHDPCELVETPKVQRKKLRTEPEEAFTFELLSHVRGHWTEGPIFMALVLAFRRGETAGFQWSDIERKALEIHIGKQRHPLLGMATPKAGSDRIIPITEEILEVIDRLGNRNSIFVFTDEHGRPIKENELSKIVPKLIEGAGLRRCTYHDLRSYAASNLLEMGVDIQAVSDILGHAMLSTTALYLNSKRRARRKAIAAYFGALVGRQA